MVIPNLRVWYKGVFETKTKKRIRDYVNGELYLRPEMYQISYLNLVAMVKNEMKVSGDFELWYRRKGLTLFTGLKQMTTNEDVEALLTTIDKAKYVDLYVLHLEPTKTQHTNPHLPQNTTLYSHPFRQKLPSIGGKAAFRCKRPEFRDKIVESSSEESTDEYVDEEEEGSFDTGTEGVVTVHVEGGRGEQVEGCGSGEVVASRGEHVEGGRGSGCQEISGQVEGCGGSGEVVAGICGNFKVHAKVLNRQETFQIMSLRLSHTCGWSDFNSKVTAEFLAEKYLDCWSMDPEWKVEFLQKRVMTDLGVEVGYHKAYNAKDKALKLLNGEASEQYKRVWDYAETIKKYNEGSSVFIKLTNIERPPPLFQRMYMCLEACKVGFVAGCRPILGVDGCHLKGTFSGQLLTAVGKDSNFNLYPIAWAVVEVENTESWSWFLQLLMADLQIRDDCITIISDRHKGLLQAFNQVVPNAEIRFCCRHIWANFKQTYPGEAYKQCFWRIARAFTKAEFDKHMETMKSMSTGAHEYLMSIPLQHWCRHAFTTKSKSAMLLNNLCESFNNVLRKCRDKPILSVMEWIRRYLMKKMFTKREGGEKYEGVVMPGVVKQLEIIERSNRKCEAVQSGLNTFEVDDHDDRFVVDLEKRTCTCYRWDLTGVPCCHAYASIRKKRLDQITFVHEFYTKERYMKAYTPTINPVPGPKHWEKTSHVEPDPPSYKKMPGRPSSKKRRKELGEASESQRVKKPKSQKKCGNCGAFGHNRKGCTKPKSLPPPRQQRTSTAQNRSVVQATQGHPSTTSQQTQH